MTKFSYIPMGDVLTSGDLLEGHNDLGQPILVDLREKNNNTPKTDWLFACKRFVLQLKPDKFKFKKMAAVTLEIMSRSSYSYGKKVLVRTNICDIEKDVVLLSY